MQFNTAIAMQYHPHYLHAGHLGGGGVGAVCGEGDETDVALGVAAVLEVSHDGHQTRVLALTPGAQYLEDFIYDQSLSKKSSMTGSFRWPFSAGCY